MTDGAGNGQINGVDNTFNGIGQEPGDGDTASGGQGPVNTTFGPAQIPCLTSMWDQTPYHVHAFVGIYYNGTQIALPDGVGMADPGMDDKNGFTYTVYGPKCYYQMHTHDASGLVHVEVQPNNNFPQQTDTYYKLSDLLGLWGVGYSENSIGQYSGVIMAFTSGQFARGGPGTKGEIGSNTYTLYNGDWTQIPLYSHEVIWIDIGSGNPTYASLPNVAFWTEW